MYPYPVSLLAHGDARDIALLRADDRQGVIREVQRWHVHESVRVLRGRRMTTWAALYSEVAAALQFPIYFGENLDAMDESLSEPDQEPILHPRLCVVTEPQFVLSDEEPDQLRRFIGSLRTARSRWETFPPEHAKGVDPVFSVVIAPFSDPEPVKDAWMAAGAIVTEVWAARHHH